MKTAFDKNTNTLAEEMVALLYSSTGTAEAINAALSLLGERLGASRAYIGENSPDFTWSRRTFEWCAEGVNAQKSMLRHFNYVRNEKGENIYLKSFNDKGFFICTDPSALPGEAGRIIVESGVNAFFQYVLYEGSIFRGFIGFDFGRSEAFPAEADIYALAWVLKLVGMYLIKSRKGEEAEFSVDFVAALDTSPTLTALIDPFSYEVVYSNHIMRAFTREDCNGMPCYLAFRGQNSGCELCPINKLIYENNNESVELTVGDKWLLAQASRIRWSGRDLVMITAADITVQKNAELELRERNAENAIVIEQSGKSLMRYDIKRDELLNYGNVVELYHIDRVIPNLRKAILNFPSFKVLSPQPLLDFVELMRSGAETGSANIELIINGEHRWFHSDFTTIFDAEGKPSHSMISSEDISDRIQKELALEKMQNDLTMRRNSSTLYVEANLTNDRVELIEGTGKEFVNGSAETSTIDELTDSLLFLIYVEDREGYREFFNSQRLNALYSVDVFEDAIDFRVITGDIIRWMRASIQMVRSPYSEDIKLFVVVTNTDKEHREKERLENLAYHDSLTGVLNREATEDRIRSRIKFYEPGKSSAMFIIDLDDFKNVNDTKGHVAGDMALTEVAAILMDVFDKAKNSIVGRIGGDEFMAFVPSCTEDEAEAFAQRIVSEVQISIGNYIVTTSVGVNVAANETAEFGSMYLLADEALYRSKNAGKSKYSVSFGEASSAVKGGAEEKAPEDPTFASVQLKTLMEQMDGGIVLANIGESIKISYISPSFFRAMHIEAEASNPYDAIINHIHPEDWVSIKSKLMNMKPGENCDAVYRVADRINMWHHLRVSCIGRNEDGSRSILAIVTDVTELKRTEQKLRFAEEKYRIAAKQMGGFIWEVDIYTNELFVTPELTEFFGANKTNIHRIGEGKISKKIAATAESELELKRMLNDIQTGVEGRVYTMLVRAAKGKELWIKANFSLLRDAEGAAYRAIGVIESLTNLDSDIRTYQEELRFMELVHPYISGELRVDFSTGAIEKCSLDFTDFCADTLGEFLERCGELFASQHEAARFKKFINQERITAEYRHGRGWIYDNFVFALADGKKQILSVIIHLIRRASSGSVMGFFYIRRVNTMNSTKFSQEECDSATMLCSRETLLSEAPLFINSLGPGEHAIFSIFELANMDKIKTMRGLQTAQHIMYTAGRICRFALEGDGITAALGENRIAVLKSSSDTTEGDYENEELARQLLERVLTQTLVDIPVEIGGAFASAIPGEMSFSELVRCAQLACAAMRQMPKRRMGRYISLAEASRSYSLDSAENQPNDKSRIVVISDNPEFLDMVWSALNSFYLIDVSNFADAKRLIYKSEYKLAICDFADYEGDLEACMEDMKDEANGIVLPIITFINPGDTERELKLLDLAACSVISLPIDGDRLNVITRNAIKRVDYIRRSENQRFFEMRFQQQENQLYAAEHDSLTGLLNQQSFCRYARERILENPDKNYVIIRWDIDNFKIVNDTMGVEEGDSILRGIGDAIRRRNYENCLCARLSADHFAYLMEEKDADPEKLFADVVTWFSAYSEKFKITNCMGVYRIQDRQLDVAVMCDRALLALRSVKGNFSTHIGYYDEAMRDSLIAAQKLARDMLPAIERHEFKVFFQPQYNYADGSILGAEALVRWEHPTLGFLSPDKFIPLFEENGMIFLLDEYVWEESCRYMSDWLKNKDKVVPISVAVNVSRVDLYVPNIAERIKKLVESYGLPTSYLRLEITESAYMQNSQRLISVVRELHDLGFTVEMDDFGSGYSSLNMLKDVPVDILKLDIRFLSAGDDNPRGGNILSSVIRMAHWLKIPIIAEGVEKREQAEYLKSLNCIYMQGYFFARPMSAGEFENLIDRSNISRADQFSEASTSGMKEFWDPTTQSTLIFNSFIGAVCIMEYNGETLELVRSNEAFYREFNWTGREASASGRNYLEMLDFGNRTIVKTMGETLKNIGDEAECELCTLMEDEEGIRQWLRCRAKFLARNGDSGLYYVAIENITERKLMEEKARGYIKEISKYQRASEMGSAWEDLILTDPNTVMFVYFAEIDRLTYKYSTADGKIISGVEKDFFASSNACLPEMRDWQRRFNNDRSIPDAGYEKFLFGFKGGAAREYNVKYAAVRDTEGKLRTLVGGFRLA